MNRIELNHRIDCMAVDPDEAREAYHWDLAKKQADDWYAEYLLDGRIDDLDWDSEEILFKCKSLAHARVLGYLEAEALNWVNANPEYYYPDFDWGSLEDY